MFLCINIEQGKIIDFHIDLNILRTTGAMENLTPPAGYACSSRYYRYKRIRTAEKINSVELEITRLLAENHPKPQYLLFTPM